MSRTMLINATRSREVRAAIVDEKGALEQLEFEVHDAGLLKGNVYKGIVANVEASLNACFVDIGTKKQGFLPFDEIAPEAYHVEHKGKGKPRIEDVIKRRKPIVVQVVKDATGNKGVALTTKVSLAGRFLVLMPRDDVRGISRKVESDSQRKKIKEIAATLKVPDEYGFIVRTAGTSQTKTDLNRDAAQLVRIWKDVLRRAKRQKGPCLLYEDRDLVVRMLRDYLAADTAEIVIDEPEAHARATAWFKRVMPRSKKEVELWTDKVPLFSARGLEPQIEAIFSRRVDLPSGGYVIIDPTEALTSIDVNSGRSTKQKSQEDTALHTNLEAADEIARQLRLRDVGGLIVVDFIDMNTPKQNRQVEKALKEALKKDKARTYVGKISDNGLCEVNRQRIKQALQLQTHRDCPMCSGRGIVPTPDFVVFGLLRRITAKAATGHVDKVVVALHPDVATHLLNEHRREVTEIEDDFGLLVRVEARSHLALTQQDIRWLSKSQLSGDEQEDLRRHRERVEALKAATAAVAPPVVDDDDEPDDDGLDALIDGEDEEAEAEAAEAAETGEAAEAEQDDRPKRKRRRRRRRGRKRDEDGLDASGEGDGEDGAEDADDEDAEAEDADDADDADEVTGESDAEDEDLSRSQKRRRRRRRRRRGGRSDEAEAAGPEATDDGADAAPDDEDGDEPEDEAGEAEAVGEGEAADRKRRRRRRRRRGRGGDGEESPVQASERPAQEQEEDDGPPPGEVLVPPPADSLFGDEPKGRRSEAPARPAAAASRSGPAQVEPTEPARGEADPEVAQSAAEDSSDAWLAGEPAEHDDLEEIEALPSDDEDGDDEEDEVEALPADDEADEEDGVEALPADESVAVAQEPADEADEAEPEAPAPA